MPTRDDVVEAARSFLGAKFRQCGRMPYAMDCVGLLVLTGRKIGIEIEDEKTYNFDPKPKFFLQHVRSQSVRGDREALKHGQILLFQQSGFPMHLGILAKEKGRLSVINAHMFRRQVVEQPFSEWRNLLIENRDYVGIE